MELIKIYQDNLIDARELHQFLAVRTKFSMWIDRTLINQFSENKDFFPKLGKSTGGRQSKEYLLTIDTAKKLAMMAKTTKGAEARNYFLECEKAIIQLKQNKRLEYWEKLEAVKGELKNYILGIGHNHNNYLQVDYAGRKVLFNGEPLPDEVLPNILLTARSFAIEMSNEFLKQSKSESLEDITQVHANNHNDVRNLMQENTGKLPEEYEGEGSIKKEIEEKGDQTK